jgi:transposase
LYAAIPARTRAGGTILGIARELGISRGTVRKYRAATATPERARAHYRSQLDPYEPYLRRRWAEGCRNGLQLWRELRERGYAGGSRRVSRWAQLRRTEPAPETPRSRRPTGEATVEPVAALRRPSVPRLAWLLVCEPTRLTGDDRAWLARLQAVSTAAAAAYPLLQAIRQIIREQEAERLDAWLAEATSCGLPDLETFAAGLQRERSELLAALELPWSTGPVEGQITRLKLIKRQGYGRCSLDTLKRRLLRAA